MKPSMQVQFIGVFLIVLSVWTLRLFTSWHFVAYGVLATIIYIVFLFVSEYYLWALPIWHFLGFKHRPDLRGRWYGSLTASYDGKSQLHEININILQTADTLVVQFYEETTYSESIMAGFLYKNNKATHINYTYQTYPDQQNYPDLIPHLGLCTLEIIDGNSRLNGYYHYYHENNEQVTINYGSMTLKRV